MKKKMLAAFMAVAMVFSITACQNSAGTSNNNSGNSGQQKEAYVPKGDFNIRVFAAAGGVADSITRIAAKGLQEDYGVTAVVSNLTGASGAVAVADLDSYKPSINELAVVSMSLFTMAPLMNPDIKASLDNYEIVGSLIRDDFVLLVSSKSGIKNWDDLVAYGKNNQIIYGSNTPGGFTHVVQVALFGEAGLNAQALTSDGSNKDILAVMSGDAICATATATLAKTYIDSGEVIPIAVFSDKNYTGYNGFDVPTVKSLGYDITLPSYNFLISRAGVSKEEASGLYKALLSYRETDSFKTQAANANYIPDNTDGETLRKEIEHYAEVCKDIYDKYY